MILNERKYYVVESSDGSPISKELPTINAARKELKSIIDEDKQLGLEPGDIDYEIVEYTETGDHTYYKVVK